MLCHDVAGCRIGVFRKNLTTARKTIWYTYIKALHVLGIPYVAKRGDSTIFVGESQIEFFELDKSKDPDWNKAKGLEITAAHIEEANEIEEGGFNILMTRIGRWNDNGVPPYLVCTCNPAQGWVRTRFRDPAAEGTLEAPFLFIETNQSELEPGAMDLYKHLPPVEFARFVQNNWDFGDDPNQLIPFEWLKRSLVEAGKRPPVFIGVDVAREGNDRTVFAFGTKSRCSKIEIFTKMDTAQIGQLLIDRMKEYQIGASHVWVDVVGVGGGVVDYCRSKGYPVRSYNSGAAAQGTAGAMKFFNRKAESWWGLRTALADETYSIVNHPDVIKEIPQVRYFIDSKMYRIEDKKQMKKRLGKSPDVADAISILKFGSTQGEVIGFGTVSVKS